MEVGGENIFKLTMEHVRIVNFATSKNLVVKSTVFLHRNIYKHTWTPPDGQTHNQIHQILIDRR